MKLMIWIIMMSVYFLLVVAIITTNPNHFNKPCSYYKNAASFRTPVRCFVPLEKVGK